VLSITQGPKMNSSFFPPRVLRPISTMRRCIKWILSAIRKHAKTLKRDETANPREFTVQTGFRLA
jgi:hypothetical protein